MKRETQLLCTINISILSRWFELASPVYQIGGISSYRNSKKKKWNESVGRLPISPWNTRNLVTRLHLTCYVCYPCAGSRKHCPVFPLLWIGLAMTLASCKPHSSHTYFSRNLDILLDLNCDPLSASILFWEFRTWVTRFLDF